MANGKRWHENAVPWSIFIWVMGITTLAFSTMMVQHEQLREEIKAETTARITQDEANNQIANDIKASLAKIETNQVNLEARMVELRADIKALTK